MGHSPWTADLARSITDADRLRELVDLTAAEEAFLLSPATHGRLPLRIPPPIAARLPVSGALRRQFVPTSAELTVRPYELDDPLGELSHSPVPRLIHRYPNRVLLLVTDRCAVHCRHCFRSRFTGGAAGDIDRNALDAVSGYLQAHPEVREIILSGGDALMLPDSSLDEVLSVAREARPGIVARLATRMPVVVPSRITGELTRLLAAHAPVWAVVQVNHADELDPGARAALTRLVDSGVPVISQTVLLAGLNDDARTLDELFSTLVELRVKPYYLFQGDLAPGTSHFRVNLRRARELVAELRARLSGLSMPTFAVDIPGGAGKVPLEESAFAGEDDAGYRLRGADGETHGYPKE